jgi:hypothetical protein
MALNSPNMIQLKDAWKKTMEQNYPIGFHQKVMRRVFLLKYRGVFLALGAAVAIYFFFAGWELWTKLIDADFFESVQALMEGVSFDAILVFDTVATVAGLAPLTAVFNFLISAVFVCFAGYELKKHQLFYK